jgi:hypothetical protein
MRARAAMWLRATIRRASATRAGVSGPQATRGLTNSRPGLSIESDVLVAMRNDCYSDLQSLASIPYTTRST